MNRKEYDILTSDFAITTNDILANVGVVCLECACPVDLSYLWTGRDGGVPIANYNIQCDCDIHNGEVPNLVLTVVSQ